MPEKNVNKVGLVAVIALFTLMPMGIFGAFLGENNRLAGFAWGVGIAIALFVIGIISTFGWEWIKDEAEKGKTLPYFIIGFLVAVAISGYLALNLGSPTCIESDTDNRGSTCLEYADDGYEATSEQKWGKFWGTLPVTVIITSLVAYIVRNEREKKK
jgi:MFS family permease